MIAHITGVPLDYSDGLIIVDVQGIGYRVFVTKSTREMLEGDKPKSVSLHTYLAVRETALDLYGFLQKNEMEFFELLIGVSGIGPKSALSILNIADVETLSSAIAANDSSYLTKVSGVGAKSAQKIVIELQGKVSALSESGAQALSEDVDTIEALKALGYTTVEVREALKDVPRDVTETNQKIKEALKLLGK